MIDVHIVNQKKQRKYIDSYNMEEKKMIDMHTVKKKKVHRFLRTRCKKKKKDSINQTPQLLISFDSYSLHRIYSHIYHITPKRFFFLFFYSLVFF